VTQHLLSPTEQAFVNGTRVFTKAQQRYLRYRIKKKFRLVVTSEICCGVAAASRDGPNGSAAQAGRALAWDDVNEIEKSKKALAGIWTPDLYLFRCIEVADFGYTKLLT